MSTRNAEDEALVGTFLRHVESLGLSQSEVEDRVPGVTQSDVSRWVRDEWSRLTGQKRRCLRDYLQGEGVAVRGGGGHVVVRESGELDYDPTPDPEGSPAEQIMAFLGVRVGMRRLAGELTSKDLIAAAYTLAREDGLSAEEFQKLDRWRDQILEEERRSGRG